MQRESAVGILAAIAFAAFGAYLVATVSTDPLCVASFWSRAEVGEGALSELVAFSCYCSHCNSPPPEVVLSSRILMAAVASVAGAIAARVGATRSPARGALAMAIFGVAVEVYLVKNSHFPVDAVYAVILVALLLTMTTLGYLGGLIASRFA